MNATSVPSKSNSTAFRFADLAVVLVTLAALLAGWLLKNSVENRSIPFESSGLRAQSPRGWLTSAPVGGEVLHVTNPFASGFGTTYSLQLVPGSLDKTYADPQKPDEFTLVPRDATFGEVTNFLTLQHAQALSDFRLLDQKQVTVFGQPAYEIDYVYVESNPDLTHNQLPNIVRGLDYIFLNGDHAIVATYWADEKAFEADMGRFLQFLKSLEF
jgi:hypothetical protein